jgi:uncharacterized protein (TIGR00369 family)
VSLDHHDLTKGFNSLIGIEYQEVAADRCVAVLDADERHHQPLGLVHGGVYCALVEATGSAGAAAHAHEHGIGALVGIANSTDFYRPHRSGRIEAVATPLHQGRSQQVWQVEITRSDDGKVLARGQLRVHHLLEPNIPA